MGVPVPSVSVRLLKFVEARQQFMDTRAAWLAFLDYLKARLGADIRGTRPVENLECAAQFVRSESFECPSDPFDPDVEWFHGFERQEDVLAALDSFLLHRGLI